MAWPAPRTNNAHVRNVPAAKWVREEGSMDVMGSLTAIIAYGENGGRVQAAISDALDEARRLDDMLSNYKPHSEWSEMNRLAAQRPVHISGELFHLLAACVEYSRESNGTFDISVGPLMKVWGFYKGTGHLADPGSVRTALKSVGYRNIILNPQARTVRFRREGVELDPGGVGKGYAVDRMADLLRKEGVRSALISAGGSSIYALGAPPGKDGWRIDLMNPGKQSKSWAHSVTLCDESLSTSGSYEKYFYADGKRWSHIMDPRTGYPSEGMISVSVIAPKTLDSEVWAKPYYILGRQWTAQHKKKAFKVFLCEDKPQEPCAWVE
ncbi:MAG TPA: FAD:protein FMN transferase [Bryobacteraceae bacterium]|nr:FAD:protein FMN transferase [Bryobacteraceae bacterium]